MLDPANSVTPQLVDFVFSTVDTLDTEAGLRTPATRTRRPTDASHWSIPYPTFTSTKAVEDAVSENSDYNCKADFEI